MQIPPLPHRSCPMLRQKKVGRDFGAWQQTMSTLPPRRPRDRSCRSEPRAGSWSEASAPNCGQHLKASGERRAARGKRQEGGGDAGRDEGNGINLNPSESYHRKSVGAFLKTVKKKPCEQLATKGRERTTKAQQETIADQRTTKGRQHTNLFIPGCIWCILCGRCDDFGAFHIGQMSRDVYAGAASGYNELLSIERDLHAGIEGLLSMSPASQHCVALAMHASGST
eukprot:2791265-Rhodomonas_salina.2